MFLMSQEAGGRQLRVGTAEDAIKDQASYAKTPGLKLPSSWLEGGDGTSERPSCVSGRRMKEGRKARGHNGDVTGVCPLLKEFPQPHPAAFFYASLARTDCIVSHSDKGRWGGQYFSHIHCYLEQNWNSAIKEERESRLQIDNYLYLPYLPLGLLRGLIEIICMKQDK